MILMPAFIGWRPKLIKSNLLNASLGLIKVLFQTAGWDIEKSGDLEPKICGYALGFLLALSYSGGMSVSIPGPEDGNIRNAGGEMKDENICTLGLGPKNLSGKAHHFIIGMR
jgi:hypothetical protein